MFREIVLAILMMADGGQLQAAMESRAACETFTRHIAPYVESANCLTFLSHLPTGAWLPIPDSVYYPPSD